MAGVLYKYNIVMSSRDKRKLFAPGELCTNEIYFSFKMSAALLQRFTVLVQIVITSQIIVVR